MTATLLFGTFAANLLLWADKNAQTGHHLPWLARKILSGFYMETAAQFAMSLAIVLRFRRVERLLGFITTIVQPTF